MEPTAENRSHRGRLRFGMRTLLVVIACLALVFAWMARARQQRDAVAALRASSPAARLVYGSEAAESGRGSSRLDPARDSLPQRWFGVDYFSNVQGIELYYATDAELRQVARFRELRQLFLWRSVDVTDEGLSHLATLTNLKRLVLSDATNVTDEGLGSLARLTGLEELSFAAPARVTALGIMKLEKLKRLKRLELSCSNPDAIAAVDALRRALPNCQIRGSSDDDIH